MEIVIQFLDELDDLFAPALAMASVLDFWRFATVGTAVGAAIALHSPLIAVAGLLLAGAGDALSAGSRRIAAGKAGFSTAR